MSKIVEFKVGKNETVKNLLDEARETLINVLSLEEGNRYSVTITDDIGTKRTTESALERSKGLVAIAIEKYIDEAQEILSDEK
ncbi:hypothetical protein [Vagococcus humatus]|uniref:Uncharacterized protein n=1 Tax=Vagococcus humatus TaxID=1889241 RepID=A0A429Z5Y1_9ENTE|nr:hypothetical protein [Vagococcus humatus]RST89102.1 hypothetical protein C7P63_07385 [Vagococcus humatus]